MFFYNLFNRLHKNDDATKEMTQKGIAGSQNILPSSTPSLEMQTRVKLWHRREEIGSWIKPLKIYLSHYDKLCYEILARERINIRHFEKYM